LRAETCATSLGIESWRPVISGHEKGALTAITQIDALKVCVPILAMTHCDSAQIAEKLGQAAEYAFCANQWHETLGYRDEVFGSSGDFPKAFKEAYTYQAPYQAAESAAAVHVYVTPSSARRASTPRRCGTRSLRPSSTPSTAP
jgi:branched-chain amino acid transport system substrate-binding protein